MFLEPIAGFRLVTSPSHRHDRTATLESLFTNVILLWGQSQSKEEDVRGSFAVKTAVGRSEMVRYLPLSPRYSSVSSTSSTTSAGHVVTAADCTVACLLPENILVVSIPAPVERLFVRNMKRNANASRGCCFNSTELSAAQPQPVRLRHSCKTTRHNIGRI